MGAAINTGEKTENAHSTAAADKARRIEKSWLGRHADGTGKLWCKRVSAKQQHAVTTNTDISDEQFFAGMPNQQERRLGSVLGNVPNAGFKLVDCGEDSRVLTLFPQVSTILRYVK